MEALKERLARWSSRLQESVRVHRPPLLPPGPSPRDSAYVSVCSLRIEERCEEGLSRATEEVDEKVQFLLMELESVGNIRLEEGCSSEPWYGSDTRLLPDVRQVHCRNQDKSASGSTIFLVSSSPVNICWNRVFQVK